MGEGKKATGSLGEGSRFVTQMEMWDVNKEGRE
jgi:hypothetical protein